MKKNNHIMLSYFLIISLLIFIPILSTTLLTPKGPDFYNYFINYNGYTSNRFEAGYTFIVYIFNIFTDDILIFWFVVVTMTLSIKLYVSLVEKRKTDNYLFTSLIFLLYYCTSQYMLHESIQIRVSLALAFIVLSFLFLYRKRNLLSMLSFAVAISFHNSVLVFLIIFPLHYIINRKGTVYIYYSILLVFGVLLYKYFNFYALSQINPLVESYIDYSELEFNPFSFSLIFIYIFVLVSLVSLKSANLFGVISIHIYISLIILGFAFSQVPVIAIRILDMSTIFGIYYVLSFGSSLKLKTLFLHLSISIICFHKAYAFLFYNPIFNN